LPARTWVTGPDVELVLSADDGIAQPEHLKGIIDTGASAICVDSRITKRLGLVASNRKPVQMADGRLETATIYTARLQIPALGFDDLVQVFAIEMKSHAPVSRVLIGRSFLRNYIVNYNGPQERFEFHETDRGEDFYDPQHDE
jgi:hypothetical protein